jgi:hypothetical protein
VPPQASFAATIGAIHEQQPATQELITSRNAIKGVPALLRDARRPLALYWGGRQNTFSTTPLSFVVSHSAVVSPSSATTLTFTSVDCEEGVLAHMQLTFSHCPTSSGVLVVALHTFVPLT